MDKHPKIFHPILFAIFPVVFLYSHNTGEVFISQTLMSLAVCLAGGILLWCTLGLICKSKIKSAVLTSISLVFFFFYGHVFSLVKGVSVGSWKVGIHTYFLPVWGAFLFALMFIVFRTKKPLFKLTIIMSIIAVCLVVMSVANIVVLHAQGSPGDQDEGVLSVSSPASESIKAGKIISKPDIYFIILDAHVSADITQKYLGYDSSLFISGLRDKGFFVADKSRSNYASTIKSIPSSLNFKYLDRITIDEDGLSVKSKTYLREMVVSNRLFKFLREQGYSLVSFSTGYFTNFEDLDIVLSGEYTSNAFANELMNSTPLIALEKFSQIRFYMHYRKMKYILNYLPETAKIESPHFVFAHILCPHQPFVFDENGKFKTSGDTFRWKGENLNIAEQKADYLDQMKYVDKKISEVIDGILANSKEEPIIILQGDHGIRWLLEVDAPGINKSILNALYLPGYDYSQLGNEITPVNTFRFILNHYFGTEFEILE